MSIESQKDTISYLLTVGAITTGLTLNGVLTTLVLIATLIFWVQRNYAQYKNNKKELTDTAKDDNQDKE